MVDSKLWVVWSIAALTLPIDLSVFDSLASGTIFVFAFECLNFETWKVIVWDRKFTCNLWILSLCLPCNNVLILNVGLGGSCVCKAASNLSLEGMGASDVPWDHSKTLRCKYCYGSYEVVSGIDLQGDVIV